MAVEATVDVCVACTAPEFQGDRTRVEDAYGTGCRLPTECTTRSDLDRLQVVGALRAGHDLLHVVGHVDDDGLRCSDGHLEPASVQPVDVESFVLNACSSVDFGRALVDAGATGGIVTDRDVGIAGASRVDVGIAAALARGATLGVACSLADEFSVEGSSYRVVGDGDVRPTA